MKQSNTKILVAMSGGVDSSVTAALLVKAGYNVTGMFAVNYNTEIRNDSDYTDLQNKESCWRPDYQDAVRVAAKLGIPLVRWDFIAEYKKMVLDYMYKEYSAGRTPNPDILCNKFVKFGAWLDKAKKLGFDYLATGHYASLRKENLNPKSKILNKVKTQNPKPKLQVTSYKLQTAKDANKDQTYFLHQLNQTQLKHVMFPIGHYTKPEVRKLAKKFALPTAEKEESMGICFIGEVPMKEFLETRIKTKPGDIVLADGTIVGEHDGLAYYTIGQRIGITCHPERSEGSLEKNKRDSSALPQNDNTFPMFVVNKNPKKNQLIVGYEDDLLLYKKSVSVIGVNWISGQTPIFPLKCKVRLRHRQELQDCIIKRSKDQKIKKMIVVEFTKPQRAVTPGQFAVFYMPRQSSARAKAGKEYECLGGGVIN